MRLEEKSEKIVYYIGSTIPGYPSHGRRGREDY